MIAHFNTWDGSHDFLGGDAMDSMGLPGIYLSNFALAHSLNADLAGRAEYFRKHSRTVQFWREVVAKDRADGKFMNKTVSGMVRGCWQELSRRRVHDELGCRNYS